MECMRVFHLPGDRQNRSKTRDPVSLTESTATRLAQFCDQFITMTSNLMDTVMDYKLIQKQSADQEKQVERLESYVVKYRILVAQMANDTRDFALKTAEEKEALEVQIKARGDELALLQQQVEDSKSKVDSQAATVAEKAGKYDRSLRAVA